MRILILDDDKSYGSLMSSAAKKLGHKGTLRLKANDAIACIEASEVDVALVDIDMPDVDAFEFTALLKERDLSVPMAYCVGTCADSERIKRAEQLAPVLPKIWTHADLKVVLAELRKQLRHGSHTFAQGTPSPPAPRINAARVPQPQRIPAIGRSSSRESLGGSLGGSLGEPLASGTGAQRLRRRARTTLSPELASALAQIEENTPRIRIRCQSWKQVRSLCNDVSRGINSITVRTRESVEIGHEVIVALALPDEMVVSIPGRVVAARDIDPDGKTPSQIELVGLGQEQLDYLMSRQDANLP